MFSTTHLIIGLILMGNVNCGRLNPDSYLLGSWSGQFCSMVYASTVYRTPKITIDINNTTDIEWAVLVAKNLEMKEIDFPYGRDFQFDYPNNSLSLVCQEGDDDCETGLFRLPNPPSQHSKLGKLNLDSGSNTLEYEVTEDGVYCVFVAPNDTDTSHFYLARVTVTQGYGYLPYYQYSTLVTYSLGNLIYFVVLALFGIYLIAFRRDYKHLSVLSHTVLFYVLLPYFILNLGRQASLSIVNRWGSTDTRRLLWKLEDIFRIVLIIFNFGVAWLILIFMNGYGVIYNSINEIHISNRLKSYFLLFWAVLSVTFFDSQKNKSSISTYIWWGIFLGASGYSYRNTRQSLKELKRQDLVDRYHWTIIVMVVIVIFDLGGNFFVSEVYKKLYHNMNDSSRDVQINACEQIFGGKRGFYKEYIKFSDYLIATTCFFFIWIRDNKGLILDEETEGMYQDEVEQDEFEQDNIPEQVQVSVQEEQEHEDEVDLLSLAEGP